MGYYLDGSFFKIVGFDVCVFLGKLFVFNNVEGMLYNLKMRILDKFMFMLLVVKIVIEG